jgi:probable rRNA maturation factor
VRRWVLAALTTQNPARAAEITVRFTGSEEAQQLNREHRGKNYATNVLTFNLHDETLSGVPIISDLVICVPVVAREAHEQSKTFRAHCAHMVVHGVLHACGLDHQEDAEAEHMETLETQVLRRFRS